jgi:hypothetical protein
VFGSRVPFDDSVCGVTGMCPLYLRAWMVGCVVGFLNNCMRMQPRPVRRLLLVIAACFQATAQRRMLYFPIAYHCTVWC